MSHEIALWRFEFRAISVCFVLLCVLITRFYVKKGKKYINCLSEAEKLKILKLYINSYSKLL